MEHLQQTSNYTRHIDELGRIVLPIEVRKKLNWQFKDSISISYTNENTVIMQLSSKYPGPQCIFCSADESVRTINGKDICGVCLESIVQ